MTHPPRPGAAFTAAPVLIESVEAGGLRKNLFRPAVCSDKHTANMQPIRLALMCFVLAALWIQPGFAQAPKPPEEVRLTLTDGSTAIGKPISFTENGLLIREASETLTRIHWTRMSQDSLKALAENPAIPAKDRAFVEPFVEDYVKEAELRRQIIVNEPAIVPARPTGTKGMFAMFGSPLGITLLLLAFAANVYAGFELALFRNQPVGMGLGLGLIPIVGPLVFAFIPTRLAPPPPEEEEEEETPAPAEAAASAEQSSDARGRVRAILNENQEAQVPEAGVPAPQPVTKKKGHAPTITMGAGATDIGLAGTAGANTAAAPGPAPAAETPSQVQVFEKGKFIFNRRFFETKMPGFFRAVPREEEQHLVVYIKAARGEFVGKRITSIDQSQLALQIFKGDATADETIPFMEIQEVRIQPHDA